MNIYITPLRRKELQEYAKEHSLSMSTVIDKALEMFFNTDKLIIKAHPLPQEVVSQPNPSENASQVILEGQDEDGNTKPKPFSKTRACPFCKKQIYTEFAQKHYNDNHEGAQI